MNVAALANTIYAALCNNTAAEAAIRTEFASLALSVATDPTASATVTSATVNGQTFTARATMTQGERLRVLRWVVAAFDNGGPISKFQISTF